MYGVSNIAASSSGSTIQKGAQHFMDDSVEAFRSATLSSLRKTGGTAVREIINS